MNKSYSTFIFSMVLLGACSTGPRLPENSEEKVVSRANALESRPDWLDETQSMSIRDGLVTALGTTTIPGDNRVEAAYRIAENNAKSVLASSIESRMSFVFQNAEEGSAIDATQARFIGAEASDIVTSSLKPGRRYWEKVATTRDDGTRVTQYRVFSTVTMAESDFKRAILEATRKREGKGGLSPDFAKKVEQHWDKFVESSTPPKAAEVK